MRVIFPCPLLYICINHDIVKQLFGNTFPVSTKFHANTTVEKGLRVCSNGHAPMIVMPMYGKKKKKNNNKKHILLLQNEELLK